MNCLLPSVILGFLIIFAEMVIVGVVILPMYIFRWLIILLAKWFRTDLSEIMDPQDSMFVNDLFEFTPPRSNVVGSFTFEGTTTLQKWKDLITQNWIQSCEKSTGKLGFQKFQMYLVRWLGFTFWKKASSEFSIDNHVHKLFGQEILATHEQVLNAKELLLNSRLPRKQSPWEVYIVENFKNPVGQPGQNYSVVIFKWHHSLADASMSFAMCKAAIGKITLPELLKPNVSIKEQKRTWWQGFLQSFKHFINSVIQLSYYYSKTFATHPLKVPDSKKEWYQFLVSSEPIKTQLIKDIKNSMGSSFTSVLLSGLTSAISKHLAKQISKTSEVESVLCANVTPLPRTQRTALELGNRVGSSILNLKLGPYYSSVERLNSVQKEYVKGRKSIIHYISYFWSVLMGSLMHPLTNILTKNKWIPIGFSNVPNISFRDNEKGIVVVNASCISGATPGDMGIFVAVVSSEQTAIILASVEKSVMSKVEAAQFVQHIADEITELGLAIESNGLGHSKINIDDTTIIL